MLNDPLRRVVPKPGNREGPKITDELMHLNVEAGVFFDGGKSLIHINSLLNLWEIQQVSDFECNSGR